MKYILLVVRQYFFAFAVLGLSITAFFATFFTFVFLLAGQLPQPWLPWSFLLESEGGRLAVLAMLHLMTLGRFRSLIWPRFMDCSAAATFVIAGVSGGLALVGLQMAMGNGGIGLGLVVIVFLTATVIGALADRFEYQFGGGGGAPFLIVLWLGRLICGRENYDRFVGSERLRVRAELDATPKKT